MASERIPEVTAESFDEAVLRSAEPVLVDFWAPWCGPCLAVAPVLEELAEELAGRVRIVKLDIDQHAAIATRYAVTSIPTFILFKGGELADRMLGAVPKAAFRALLERNR
jgi:thioredoxin 1